MVEKIYLFQQFSLALAIAVFFCTCIGSKDDVSDDDPGVTGLGLVRPEDQLSLVS